jgi:hypothetical protein
MCITAVIFIEFEDLDTRGETAKRCVEGDILYYTT